MLWFNSLLNLQSPKTLKIPDRCLSPLKTLAFGGYSLGTWHGFRELLRVLEMELRNILPAALTRRAAPGACPAHISSKGKGVFNQENNFIGALCRTLVKASVVLSHP